MSTNGSPILEVRDLHKSFEQKAGPLLPARAVKAVAGVDLRLYPGETLGLAGESGCGKSTLAKMIMGLTTPSSGEIVFKGTPLQMLSSNSLADFRKTVQMVFQDPFASLNPRMRIGEIIAEPMNIHRIAPATEIRGRVARLMQMVGISPELYDRYPHEFSGGQRQRIGIARAIAVSPQAIIADEPLSALDISIQAQIINLLQELQQSLKLAYLLISHDLSVIRHMSDRVAIMYLGKIVEEGESKEIFTRCLHPYTEALLAAIPGEGGQRRKPKSGEMLANGSGCPFLGRCPYAGEICRQAAPRLEEKLHGHSAACHFSKDIFLTG